MQRIRRHAELRAAEVKLLRRELRIAHKKNRTEDGEMGITWWSREYWDEGKGIKKLTVKKEEPSSPIWWGQDYKPSMPMLTYPSLTPTSRYQSLDPNDLYGHLDIDHRQYKSFYSIIICRASGIC